jgi:alcohol dehydrogenase class IV
MPPKLLIGDYNLSEMPGVAPGIFDLLAADPALPRKKAFLVTDEIARRYAEKVAATFRSRGFATHIWDGVKPEVPLDTVKLGADEATKFEPDIICGVGGGSAIDTSKAVFILYEHPETDLGMVTPTQALNLRNKAKLMAAPTTSGTGAEVTAAAVLSDPETKRKVPISHPELLPDIALIIPSFTLGMPPKLTAGTGLDALAHAMDCVPSLGTNDITDPLALRSIQMIFRWLPVAYKDGSNHEARRNMHIAATIAGLAFGHGGIGHTHSLGHALGMMFHVHHGVAVGVFIPYTQQYYARVTEKYLDICEALKVRGRTKAVKLAGLCEKVKGLMKDLDIVTDIKGLGVSRDDFKKSMKVMVEYACEDPDNFQSPRSMTPEQCEKLFWYAYEGKDVDF